MGSLDDKNRRRNIGGKPVEKETDMSKPTRGIKTKWDSDEILFKVSLIEVFIQNGREVKCSDNNGEKLNLYECRMEMIAPSKATAGAMFNYAVDYAKYHNLKSENYFKVMLYNVNTGGLVKSKIVKAELTETEFNAMLHNDYLTFSNKDFTRELRKPVFYTIYNGDEKDKPIPKREYSLISVSERKQIADEYQRFAEREILKQHNITKSTLDEILVAYGTDIIWGI